MRPSEAQSCRERLAVVGKALDFNRGTGMPSDRRRYSLIQIELRPFVHERPSFTTNFLSNISVPFFGNKEQSHATHNGEDCPVIKHSSVTKVVPQQTSDNTGEQFHETDDCTVPTHRTGAQKFWHEV